MLTATKNQGQNFLPPGDVSEVALGAFRKLCACQSGCLSLPPKSETVFATSGSIPRPNRYGKSGVIEESTRLYYQGREA